MIQSIMAVTENVHSKWTKRHEQWGGVSVTILLGTYLYAADIIVSDF